MAILDNLISYWALDEASGNALDSHGSNTLTETSGTIGSAAGKIGTCRDFELGDTANFSVADNAALSTGDIDFSVAAWVQFESVASSYIVTKHAATGNQREFALFYTTSGTDGFRLSVSNDGTAEVVVEWPATPTPGVWYFVACGHSAAANDIWISVDGGTPVTASHATGVFDSTTAFMIGARAANAGHFDGLIDEVGFWKRDIRSNLAALYNSGNGFAYPFVTDSIAGVRPPIRDTIRQPIMAPIRG